MSTIVRPYTHVQSTPSSVWVIAHGLDRAAVDVVVYNDAGLRITGCVERIDNFTSRVSFFEKGEPFALSGIAEVYHVGCIQDFITSANLGVQSTGQAALGATTEGGRVVIRGSAIKSVVLSKQEAAVHPFQSTRKSVNLGSLSGTGTVALSAAVQRVSLSKRCT